METESRTGRRVGMVIGLREDNIEAYKSLHADDHPGVRDLLQKYHIHNFLIFLHRLPDGRHYEFATFEYRGTDFDKDMAELACEPRNQAWLARCDPMQLPLPGEASWAVMEAIYFNP